MPGPVITTDPADNVLELNVTTETMSFSSPLGSVPNRGSKSQADIFLNGVPYLQAVNDVTTGTPIGIHLEPGIWLQVPATTNPHEPITVTRMASIPHGTTIMAQGVALDVHVPPIPHGTPPITLAPVQKSSVPVVPSFIASIPSVSGKGFAGGTVKVPTIQIQYSQKVMLDFAGLSWPHVSVASLVPAAPVPIPASLLPLT
jgi:hypothetical protein